MLTIPDFYANRDLLISGGSGFMGQVLIEKLLRSCSDVNSIFVMMRPKKGKSPKERLEQLKQIKLFDLVKKIDPSLLDKIVPIEGDVQLIGLGFSDESKRRLQNVSIIFHLAASVRFDDPLKDAVILNTRGTYEMIKFALELSHLESFVHVSTTYCNPDKIYIEEKIYPPHGNWRKVIQIAETLDNEVLEILMPKFTDYMPNTYTYTKGLAEQICNDYKDRLPIVVFRPSIVVGTEREPVVGWCDNFNGPVGLLVACGHGILRTMYASGKEVLDCITADVVIKAMLVSSWASVMKKRTKHQVDPQLNIYNCSSLHSVNLNFMIEDGKQIMQKVPFKNALWVADGGVTTCKFMNYARMVVTQILPALLIDQFILKPRGEKPFLMKIQRKITHAILALRIFVLKEWKIDNRNFLDLNNVLLAEDWETFNMKRSIPSDLDLFTELIIGARKYLFNETSDSIDYLVARYRRKLMIHRFIKYTFRILVIYVIFTYIKKVF